MANFDVDEYLASIRKDFENSHDESDRDFIVMRELNRWSGEDVDPDVGARIRLAILEIDYRYKADQKAQAQRAERIASEKPEDRKERLAFELLNSLLVDDDTHDKFNAAIYRISDRQDRRIAAEKIAKAKRRGKFLGIFAGVCIFIAFLAFKATTGK